MEQQAQPEGCFCCRDDSTVQLPPAVCTEVELFSSSHRQRLGNGISGRCILFTANPTGVFLTALYCAVLRAKSTGVPIKVAKIVSALFTSCLPGPLENGTGESSIAFKPEATATVRSAISFATQSAIFMVPRVKAV